MELRKFANLVRNKSNNQYSLTLKAKELSRMKVQPNDLLRAKINFFDLKRR